eukprot:CAMPEP_0170588174 /NCGR_PEP_ID=MMETSP0224-20130122/10689_1 /TAXON_ID=285029 /ORGANISM="Togula jolla, Strain CCCM 725" /LENGTH=224 /DNA_ID=CAMNT_0010911873 /DNA_START=304 /DNA_END=975 /DNA_ORIENTATION=+
MTALGRNGQSEVAIDPFPRLIFAQVRRVHDEQRVLGKRAQPSGQGPVILAVCVRSAGDIIDQLIIEVCVCHRQPALHVEPTPHVHGGHCTITWISKRYQEAEVDIVIGGLLEDLHGFHEALHVAENSVSRGEVERCLALLRPSSSEAVLDVITRAVGRTVSFTTRRLITREVVVLLLGLIEILVLFQHHVHKRRAALRIAQANGEHSTRPWSKGAAKCGSLVCW